MGTAPARNFREVVAVLLVAVGPHTSHSSDVNRRENMDTDARLGDARRSQGDRRDDRGVEGSEPAEVSAASRRKVVRSSPSGRVGGGRGRHVVLPG